MSCGCVRSAMQPLTHYGAREAVLSALLVRGSFWPSSTPRRTLTRSRTASGCPMSRDDEQPPKLARRASRPAPTPITPDGDGESDDDEAPGRHGVSVKFIAVAFVAGVALMGAIAVATVMLLKRAGRPQSNPPALITPQIPASPVPRPPAKTPAAPAEPTRGRPDEAVGIDGVFVSAGASVMKDEGNRMLLMIKVETSTDCPPTIYMGWRRALGRMAPVVTLPDGSHRYPASTDAFDAVADQMALQAGMFGPGQIGGGRGRMETILFAPIPHDVGEFDLDLPGRPAGVGRPFRLRVKVDRK